MECPACGGPVTMDVGPNQPVTASVADALLAAVERAALLDDIMSEAAKIESLATLKDTLAEVRRQRRLETAGSSSHKDGDTGADP